MKRQAAAEQQPQRVKRSRQVGVSGLSIDSTADSGRSASLEPALTFQVSGATTSLRLESTTITSERDVTLTLATNVSNYYGAPLGLSKLQHKIADWLSQSPSHYEIQKEIYEKATQGTGEWFLRSSIFEDWLSKESGTLWGTGIPGAGKTYLASIILNHLTGLVIARNSGDHTSKPEVVACIYCRYSDKLSLAQILSSILVQLVEDNRQVAEHVQVNLYNPCIYKRAHPTQTEILTELKRVLPFFSRVFVVIDALDELDYDICHEVVQELVSLDRHLLITSREIRLQILPEPNFKIHAPNTDIQIFIERELGRFPKVLSLLEGKTEIHREIANKIEQKSDGMFLLAALQLSTLKGITTIKSLRTAVANLPLTLNDMYRVTLNRINNQSTEEASLALRAILWATHAIRPLSVDEFLIAVSIDPNLDNDVLDPEAIPNESTVLAVCCGLVTLGRGDRTVRLVHSTAYDFFTNCQIGFLQNSHEYAASVCTAYQQHRRFKKDLDELEPFGDYAYFNLGRHIQLSSPQAIEDIPSRVSRFLQTEEYFMLFISVGWDNLDDECDIGSACHFGALHGILPLIDISSKGLSSLSFDGYTPLDYACVGGHPSVTTHILTYPSESLLRAESRFWSKHTIRLASKRGYDSVVKFLLDQPGVDVNAVDDDDETALHLASELGHIRVVELLLGFPTIDVNHPMSDERTPLHRAVGNDQHQVVELLLKFPSIQVNTPDNIAGYTALHLACKRGDKRLVQMLVDSPGIHINAKIDERLNRNSPTPLEVAALQYEVVSQPWYQENGKYLGDRECLEKKQMYKEIIKLLVEKGGVNREYWRYNSPLVTDSKNK